MFTAPPAPRAALDIMNKYRIDVVVTDISMPGMDGIEMCRHIKESWPLCRVIFLSGYRDFDYARRAVEMGVYQYLVKPVRYEDIQQTVEGALAELGKRHGTARPSGQGKSKDGEHGGLAQGALSERMAASGTAEPHE